MQPDNRVVLTCVGGRDSYAVFEAANEDAAAVLYVGESAHIRYPETRVVIRRDPCPFSCVAHALPSLVRTV